MTPTSLAALFLRMILGTDVCSVMEGSSSAGSGDLPLTDTILPAPPQQHSEARSRSRTLAHICVHSKHTAFPQPRNATWTVCHKCGNVPARSHSLPRGRPARTRRPAMNSHERKMALVASLGTSIPCSALVEDAGSPRTRPTAPRLHGLHQPRKGHGSWLESPSNSQAIVHIVLRAACSSIACCIDQLGSLPSIWTSRNTLLTPPQCTQVDSCHPSQVDSFNFKESCFPTWLMNRLIPKWQQQEPMGMICMHPSLPNSTCLQENHAPHCQRRGLLLRNLN